MATTIIFPIVITPAATIITRNSNHNYSNTNRRALTHIIHNNNNATTVDFNNHAFKPGQGIYGIPCYSVNTSVLFEFKK